MLTLSRWLMAISMIFFAAGIVGGIYWRWIAPPSSPTAADITAAWRDAISTFEVGAAFAIFTGIVAIYLRGKSTT